MEKILFICTGNYYRSRFAEILFNYIAEQKSIPAISFSRGLRLNPEKNIGPISAHAENYLILLNIPLNDFRMPAKLKQQDLEQASKIIVMDESEHRPMMRLSFPAWEEKVEYWRYEDDYIVDPEIVLPLLKDKIDELIISLGT